MPPIETALLGRPGPPFGATPALTPVVTSLAAPVVTSLAEAALVKYKGRFLSNVQLVGPSPLPVMLVLTTCGQEALGGLMLLLLLLFMLLMVA